MRVTCWALRCSVRSFFISCFHHKPLATPLHPWALSLWLVSGLFGRTAAFLGLPSPSSLHSLAMNDNVRNKCPQVYGDCSLWSHCSRLQQDPCALRATRMHAHACPCAHVCTQCIHMHTHDAEYAGVGPIMPVGLLSLRDLLYILQPKVGCLIAQFLYFLPTLLLFFVDWFSAVLEAPLTLNFLTSVSLSACNTA